MKCQLFCIIVVIFSIMINSASSFRLFDIFGGSKKVNNINANTKNSIESDLKASVQPSSSSVATGTAAPPVDSALVELKIKESKGKILDGKLESSIESLIAVVEADEENFEGNRLLGAVLLSLNQSKIAEGFLYNAVRISKWKDLHSIANLAESLRVNGDPILSEKVALKGLNATSAHDDGILAFTLGAIYQDLGNYVRSSEWYQVSAIRQVNNIEAWLRASTMKFPSQFQNFSTAEFVLYKANQANPDNVELIYNLALALHMENRPAEAIKLYNVVRDLDPQEKVADVKGALATALHSVGNVNEAFRFYQLAINANQNSEVLLSNFAILLCSNGLRKEGVELVRRAYSIAPNSEDTKKAMSVCDVRVQM
jgi:tetratricopeptide (TPR) repeat protein